jgi:hypothetical protein
MRTSIIALFTGLSMMLGSFVFASEEDDMARMQQQLNQETMAKEFFAEEPEKVEAFIKDAMKKNIKPLEYKGSHWRRGYTCRNLLAFSWREYRDCRHYHRYYGRYYSY